MTGNVFLGIYLYFLVIFATNCCLFSN